MTASIRAKSTIAADWAAPQIVASGFISYKEAYASLGKIIILVTEARHQYEQATERGDMVELDQIDKAYDGVEEALINACQGADFITRYWATVLTATASSVKDFVEATFYVEGEDIVTVPMEPTQEMVDAAVNLGKMDIRAIWKAMVEESQKVSNND